MSKKIRWGVLSTAKIGINKIIPAMQQGRYSEIAAIASRDLQSARFTAEKLGIPGYYGSYDDLIADNDIDAIYNPLPHHLHFEWTKNCIEAGKHVLCEKPLVLKTNEVKILIKLRDQYGVKVGEAFMVHTHPQWTNSVERIWKGDLGVLTAIQGFFSYNLHDPGNIRNILEYGGGGLWDIGCYPVHTSRFAFDEEPERVMALVERDPVMKIDRMASFILQFPSGHASFVTGTQMVPHQKMRFFGTKKMLEISIPFNAPNDRACEVQIDDGDLFMSNRQRIQHDICDQYTIQGDAFSKAIIQNGKVPVSLENALHNTAVINALFKSEETGNWESPGAFL